MELLEGHKEEREQGIRSHRKGSTPGSQLTPLIHRKGDMKHPSHLRTFADASTSTSSITFLSPQHLLLTQLTPT